MVRGKVAVTNLSEGGRSRSVEATRLEEAGRSARRGGDFATARRCFEAAIALLGNEDPARRARLQTQLSRVLWLLGDGEASLGEAERAVRTAPGGGSQAKARARLAVILSHAGRTAEAHEAARLALEAAVSASDTESEGIARMALGYTLRSMGRPAAAAREVRLAVPLAVTHGDGEAVVARLIDLANSEYLAGNGQAAVEAAARSVAEARRRGVALGMPAATHALFLFHTGGWQQAMRAVDDGLAGEPRFPWLVLMRAQLMVGRGDLAAARRWLSRSERLAAGPRPGGWDGPQETHAELLLWGGDPDGALARVHEALETAEVTERGDALRGLVVLGLRAAADLRELPNGSSGARWRGAADRLIDLLRRHGALMRDGHPREVGGHLPGMEALAEAEYARAHGLPAADAWEHAVTLQEAMGDPWRATYACLRFAQALRREAPTTGEVDPRADEALVSAFRAAVRLRARLMQRAVEAEAALGAHSLLPTTAPLPASAAPREPRGLTPRERQVLVLLGRGSTNRQIARQLGISEKTVSVHVGSITGKLGVANRLEAVAVAIRLSMRPIQA